MSEGLADSVHVEDIVKAEIPGCISVNRATTGEDKHGTDWWAVLPLGRLSIDAKVRGEDYASKYGLDDLALETWSVIESRKVGWTRDVDKNTDYVLWIWKDTGRWCLIPFRMLCRIMMANWKVWRKEYKTAVQATIDKHDVVQWHSECVYVPRRLVWRKIYETFGGTPVNKP